MLLLSYGPHVWAAGMGFIKQATTGLINLKVIPS
jgi:hypothetical protein